MGDLSGFDPTLPDWLTGLFSTDEPITTGDTGWGGSGTWGDRAIAAVKSIAPTWQRSELSGRNVPVRTQQTPTPQTVGQFALGPRQINKERPEMLGDQTSAFLDQANRQRQAFVDAQNAAIKAAGRGAGAPYAAEIARLDQAIALAQRDLGNVGALFNNKIAEQSAWWDQSITKLGTSYDESIARSQSLQTEGRTAVDHVYSNAQARTLSVLANVPGMDEASKIAALETIGTLEGAIMAMVDVTNEGARGVMQASEDLAVTLAKQSKAKTNLEFVRERILIEEGIKGEINNMLEQRKAASRAQAAARSAARAEAAARLPDNWAFDQGSMAQSVAAHYLENAMSGYNDNVQQIVFDTAAEMWQQGLDYNGARQWLKSMDTTGMSWEVINALKQYLPLTMQAFNQGADQWRSYVGQDPSQYDRNSAEYAYAVAANNSWMSEDEIRYTLGNPDSPQGVYATTAPTSSSARSSTSSTTTRTPTITPRGDVR